MYSIVGQIFQLNVNQLTCVVLKKELFTFY